MADDNGLDPQDLDLLARTMIGEESTPQGRAAVGAVVLNRMKSGQYPGSVSGVVMQPNAFESWGSRAKQLNAIDPNSADYQSAYKIAQGVANGSIQDPTGGATNFINPRLQVAMGRQIPSWAQGQPSAVIGEHSYFAPQKQAMDTPDLLGSWKTAPAAPTPATSAAPGQDASAVPDLLGSWKTVAPASDTSLPSSGSGVAYIGDRPVDFQGGVPVQAPPATFDPHTAVVQPGMPLQQQLQAAGTQTSDYLGNQIRGIPGAIGQDFSNALSLAGQGLNDVKAGNVLPTMPSLDPRTWQPGGALETVLGATAAPLSIMTGPVRQLVQDPVTQATGNPVAGETAGFVANLLGGGPLSRAAGGAVNALQDATLGTIDPASAALAQAARDKFGIQLTAPQLSSSPALRFIASTLNKLPFSGAGADAAEQQAALNRAVASEMGVTADKVTPDVIKQAKQTAYDAYDQAKANIPSFQVDQPFFNALRDVADNAQYSLEPDKLNLVKKQLRNVVGKVDPSTGTIDADQFQSLTRKNGPLDNAINSRDSAISNSAQDIKNALDGLATRTSPLLKTLKDEADYKYFVAKSMENSPTSLLSPTGDVNALRLFDAVQGSETPVGQIGQIGRQFFREPPSSGTMERTTIGHVLKNALLYGGGALGLDKAFGISAVSPTSALVAGASVPASLLGGRLLGSALRSDTLANSLINRSLPRAVPPSGVSILPYALSGAGSIPALNRPSNALAAPNQ